MNFGVVFAHELPFEIVRRTTAYVNPGRVWRAQLATPSIARAFVAELIAIFVNGDVITSARLAEILAAAVHHTPPAEGEAASMALRQAFQPIR